MKSADDCYPHPPKIPGGPVNADDTERFLVNVHLRGIFRKKIYI